MSRRPLIGISMRLELETRRFYLGRDYSEAVAGSGGVPLHVSLIPEASYISEILQKIDGILLPGSDTDVDPLLFGEEPHPRLKRIVPEKDATDLALLEGAERLKKPVLGICFGMQVLNVSRGGSLYQDIEASIENSVKHEQGKPLERNSHSLEIEAGTRLAALAGPAPVQVNSHHHQSVKTVGDNLRASARARDGVIECIEDPRSERFVLGVQWHPELNWQSNSLSKNIFETFIRACQN